MSDTDMLYLEYMRLDDFIARFHPANPKAHDTHFIGNLVDTYGFAQPPTIDERTGLVAAGHGRGKTLWAKYEAGESPPVRILVDSDGMWQLPVLRGIEFDSDAALKAYLMGDNQSTIAGGWNRQQLVDLWQEIDTHHPELVQVTGFDEAQITDMLNDLHPHEPLNNDSPEIDFSPELLEKSNYIVFYFDNEFDWNVIEATFGITTVKDLQDTGHNKLRLRGVGRVLDGRRLLELMQQASS